MKFIHTSDLHIGKIVNGFPMLEDQRAVLAQVVQCAREEQADAVFLCGDIYDRSVAPAAAVQVFDWFLTSLADLGLKVFVIAGNHDCGERVEFASGILSRAGVHIEGKPREQAAFVDMEDEHGPLRIHLLPFARPAEVRALYGGECGDFETAVRAQLAHARIVKGGRNILLTHHFVVNGSHLPEVCDSDSRLSVGGADQVNAALFKQFDYVALGHIHGRQRIGERHVWYSGSPLKYSFSEIHHKKCVLIGEMDAAGNVSLKERELTPLRDMRKIEGPLRELVRAGNALEENDPALSDYLLAVLTDEEELADPIGALRGVYPNIMQIAFKREEKREEAEAAAAGNLKDREPASPDRELFRLVTGEELSGRQEEIIEEEARSALEVTE